MVSDAVSLEFVLRRVDAANNNVNDMRRSMAALATRFDAIEARFTALEMRFSGMEMRMGAIEGRLDAVIALLLELREAANG